MEKTIDYDSPRNQDLLMEIEKFVQEKDASLSDLTAIEIKTGPGHFTSLRTGIAIAQALALALNIPINQQPPGTTIEARYGKPPSITTKKLT